MKGTTVVAIGVTAVVGGLLYLKWKEGQNEEPTVPAPGFDIGIARATPGNQAYDGIPPGVSLDSLRGDLSWPAGLKPGRVKANPSDVVNQSNVQSSRYGYTALPYEIEQPCTTCGGNTARNPSVQGMLVGPCGGECDSCPKRDACTTYKSMAQARRM